MKGICILLFNYLFYVFAIQTVRPNLLSKRERENQRVFRWPRDTFQPVIDGEFYINGKKYIIQNQIGEGTHSKICLVVNENKHVFAAKLMKVSNWADFDEYKEVTGMEVDIVNRILRKVNNQREEISYRNIVKYVDSGIYQGVAIILFEPLGLNLRSLRSVTLQSGKIKRDQHKNFRLPMWVIRKVAHECLCGLRDLHSIGCVHGDVRMENFAFVKGDGRWNWHRVAKGSDGDDFLMPPCLQALLNDACLKIIDFGLSAFGDESHQYEICVLENRSPEVIKPRNWGPPADLWALGCVLYDLYTGEKLFPVFNEDQLRILHSKMRKPTIGEFIKSRLRARGCKDENFLRVLADMFYEDKNFHLMDKIRNAQAILSDPWFNDQSQCARATLQSLEIPELEEVTPPSLLSENDSENFHTPPTSLDEELPADKGKARHSSDCGCGVGIMRLSGCGKSEKNTETDLNSMGMSNVPEIRE